MHQHHFQNSPSPSILVKQQKKKYSLSTNKKNIGDLRVLTSKSHFHSQFHDLLKALKPRKVLGMGSVGFKVTSILKGKADLYISYSLENGSAPKDWDFFPPFAIIKGAGGFMTDIKGNDLGFLKDDKFEQRGIIVASMNQNHKYICDEIYSIVNK